MMAYLINYWGKTIRLVDVDDGEWIGFVEGYADSNNNPEGEESIDVSVGNHLILFFPDEINSIDVLEKSSPSTNRA
ncbi:hypothetical protein [Peptoniphilus sp. EMRHCC_23]|uniref:hypothetical protein n=1 Tax=Peptoniphilus rachelemmaiella TaxID=2811779 RepID=UPI001BFFECAF|nr:hypothetical protein [Peptoniphilus rachelemmaiella]